MVQKPDIQYIHQFYVYGSEAKALEREPRKNRISLPKTAPDQKIRILIDPAALCGIVVAMAMAVLLVLGTVQYLGVCQKYQQMMDYVVTLQNDHILKEDAYHSQIDYEDITEKALALGMLPKSDVQVIYISGQLPPQEAEPTLWDEICWYFSELFA